MTSVLDHIVKQEDAKLLTHQELNAIIQKSDVFPKDVPIKKDIGKLNLMCPSGSALLHKAAPLLQFYSDEGCPCDCGPNWTPEHILAAIKKGAHSSALHPEAAICLHKETQEKIKGGYARTVRVGDIKNCLPPSIKISPIAMIPHKSRKFRAILDLSYQLRLKGKKKPSVNSATNGKAPQKSMAELGQVLKRIIEIMAKNYDLNHPFLFSKCDIKDGFWRLKVNTEDAWNFCYVLPPTEKNTPIDDLLIVVPNSLQMGWCESPPFFCAVSETGRDVIQDLLHQEQSLPQHPMEHYVCGQDTPTYATHGHKTQDKITPVDLVEVYVDDFLGITNNMDPTHLKHFGRALLHGIHSVFPPPTITGHDGGDPISEKKMQQGDGQWAHIKEILGWEFNGKTSQSNSPKKKQSRYNASSKQLPKETHLHSINFKSWQEIYNMQLLESLGVKVYSHQSIKQCKGIQTKLSSPQHSNKHY